MKTLLSLVLSVVTGLCSCSEVTPNATTLERYQELEKAPALHAQAIRITCKEIDKTGKVTDTSIVIAKVGQQATISKTQVVRYAAAFDLPKPSTPKMVNGVQTYPITPATPKAFESREIGRHLTVTPRIRGGFIEVTGSLKDETFSLAGQGAGEAFSPICDSKRRWLYTYNRVPLPQFKTTETVLHLCCLPGTENKIHLSETNRDLVMTCEVAR